MTKRPVISVSSTAFSASSRKCRRSTPSVSSPWHTPRTSRCAGYAAGITGTLPVDGTFAPAHRLIGVQTAPISIGEPDEVTIPGDDGNLGSFIFAPANIPAFIIETGADDLNVEAIMQGTLVHDEGGIAIGVLDPEDPVYADIALIGVSRARSKVTASEGVSNYSGVLIPKCNVVPMGRAEYTTREGGKFRWKVMPTRSDAFPWGRTLTNAVNGTESAVIYPWSAENRVTCEGTQQDAGGVTTIFGPLRNTPAGTTNTDVRVFVNGVIWLAGWTISTVTRLLTFAPAAPAADAIIQVFYEYVIA